MDYQNDRVKLEKASKENVNLLIDWTLDPIAQGPYKKVPNMNEKELKDLFLNNEDREYFLIKNKSDKPIGRFYFRKWHFNQQSNLIDWELNIIIADEEERGKGYGTSTQLLAIEILKKREETNSIFAYTMNENIAERRSLEKCGFDLTGNLINPYYRVNLGALNPENFVLYVLKF